MLIMAGLVIPVKHTSANGLPLGAEVNPGKQKMLLLDTGLFQRILQFEISDAVFPGNIETINKSGYQMIWQTGRNYPQHSDLPSNIKQLQFIDNMNYALAAADLVVSRSGATTIAELCVVGKPSVLVPYPGAATNEQVRNAKVTAGSGAAIIINDNEIGRNLFDSIDTLINNKQMLAAMASAAKALGRPDAAGKCANEILKAINPNISGLLL